MIKEPRLSPRPTTPLSSGAFYDSEHKQASKASSHGFRTAQSRNPAGDGATVRDSLFLYGCTVQILCCLSTRNQPMAAVRSPPAAAFRLLTLYLPVTYDCLHRRRRRRRSRSRSRRRTRIAEVWAWRCQTIHLPAGSRSCSRSCRAYPYQSDP